MVFPFSYHSPGKQIKWLEKAYNKSRHLPTHFIGNLPTRMHRAADALRNTFRIEYELKKAEVDLKNQDKRIDLHKKKQKNLERRALRTQHILQSRIDFSRAQKQPIRYFDKKEMLGNVYDFNAERRILSEEKQILKSEFDTIKKDTDSLKDGLYHAKKHLKKCYDLLEEEAQYMEKRMLQYVQHKAQETLALIPQDNSYRENIQKAVASFKKAKTAADFVKFLSEKDKAEIETYLGIYDRLRRRLRKIEKYT